MIPAHEFGGDGPPLHFAHGNGYPPATYTPLAEFLIPRFRVFGMLSRPLWPNTSPNGLRDWNPLADDLIRFLDERGLSNIVGAGHSLGSILTLLAAVRRPDLFRAIVLIDPVLLSSRRSVTWGLVKKLGLTHRVHPYITVTLRRRRVFPSAAAMFDSYRAKPHFARLDDRAMQCYLDALTRPRPDGQVDLTYPPEWEAHIYSTVPHDLWRHAPQVRCPVLVIYGRQSDTFFLKTALELQQALPSASFCAVENAGHLVPMEKPGEVAECLLAFMKVASEKNSLGAGRGY